MSHMREAGGKPFGVRYHLITAILLAGVIGLLVRLVCLQVIDRGLWQARAHQQNLTRITIPAERGVILDRCGRRLAVSRNVWSVCADPAAVRHKHFTARTLARALQGDAAEILGRLEQERRFVWIKRKVGDCEADWIRRLDLDGVGLRREWLRVYPEGRLGAHVIGFVNVDNIGMEGIEAQCDSLLHGTDGVAIVRRDGRRRRISDASTPERRPRHGKTIILTIDSSIQAICEEELARAAEKFNPVAAVAVVLEPRTGDVLAMSAWPSYDPNAFNHYDASVRRNRAVTDAFEPGSVFKPFTAAAVLEAGLASPTSVYHCHRGAWRVGSRTLHDSHGYADLTLVQVIEKSSNIGIAKIGMLLKRDGLHRAVRSFGFGRASGIDLPGECDGFVWPAHQWTSYSMTSVPMGQEILVSAVQLARGFAVFANGGLLVTPRVVLGYGSHDGAVMEHCYERPAPKRVLSESMADFMARDVLAGVVERGTGKRARLAGYTVAGKTGTAQIAREGGGGYIRGAYRGTFVGFAPAEKPRFVVLVSLERPRGRGYYGGTVAAPAVARILERSLTYVGVPQNALQTVSMAEARNRW